MGSSGLLPLCERNSTSNTRDDKSYAGIYILSCSASLKYNIFLTVFHWFFSVPVLEIYYHFEHNFSTFTKNNLATQTLLMSFLSLKCWLAGWWPLCDSELPDHLFTNWRPSFHWKAPLIGLQLCVTGVSQINFEKIVQDDPLKLLLRVDQSHMHFFPVNFIVRSQCLGCRTYCLFYFGTYMWGDWRWKLIWIHVSLVQHIWNEFIQSFIVSQWTLRHVPQKGTLLTSVWERTKLVFAERWHCFSTKEKWQSWEKAFPQDAYKPYEETQGTWILRAGKLKTVPTDCSFVSQAPRESFISFLVLCAGWWHGLLSFLVDGAREQECNSYLHSLSAGWAEKIPHLVSALVTPPEFF